jgi:hypothetical protein
MSIDTVSDLPPRVQYTAGVGQTIFAYPFPVFAGADLVVIVNGVTKALSTNYTVSGAGSDTGGNVTFLVAMVGGELVTIYRNIAIARATDVQQNGPWSSVAYNDEQDKTYLLLQQLASNTRRALRFPIDSSVTDASLQLSPTAYANRTLSFDASGNPTPAALPSTVMTQGTIGTLLWPQTALEIAAGITPVNTHYEPGDYRRLTSSAPDSEGNVTFTVGTTGFFLNINKALSLLTKTPANGVEVVLQLIAGFVMAEQVVVANGQNYGWIRIEAVDATVSLTMSALTVAANAYNETPSGNLPAERFAFFAYNGSTLPKIGVRFVANSSGAATASYAFVLLHGGSHITGLNAAGCTGLVSVGGSISYGLHVSHASTCTWWGVNVSGCDIGARTGNTCVSTVREGNFSACRIGLDAGAGSVTNAQNVNASSCTQHSVWAQATSTVYAANMNCTGTGSAGASVGFSGIRAQGTARVDATDAILDGCGRGVDSRDGAVVYLGAASLDATIGSALVANLGGTIICGAISADGCSAGSTNDSVRSETGGLIVIKGGTVNTNAAAAKAGCLADGGTIWLTDTAVTGNGAGVDLNVKAGGIIYANGSTNTTAGSGSAIVAADCNVAAFNRQNTILGWIWSNQFGESELVTGTVTASLNILATTMDSSGGAVTATLPNGAYRGQRKIFILTVATNPSTLSVTTHETSNPEVFTFDATTDALTLEWDGTRWWTVKNIGVAT